MKKKSIPMNFLILSWIMQVFIVFLLGHAAYLKLSDAPEQVALFTKLEMEPAGRYIIGFLEAVACLLILIPHAAVHGAILSFGIMCGALIAHATKIGVMGTGPVFALLVFITSAIVIYIRRNQIPSVARMMAE